jgi:RNA polymerase sigma-70 factor (ECF subfamily)
MTLSAGHSSFATTRWSLVLQAAEGDTGHSQEALAALCATYWYPLYAFIRRQGFDADQAQDHTQEFFARLLEKDYLKVADRERGRFRSFLLAACQHFLANERDKARAQKRGGGRLHVPIDFHDAEHRYGHEPAHHLTAEKLFERRWALTLLDQVLQRLRQEMADRGRGPVFELLKGCLAGEKTAASYEQLGRQLRMTEGAIKIVVHRLRKRYRELLRAEIERTVETAAEVEAEIRSLFAALG